MKSRGRTGGFVVHDYVLSFSLADGGHLGRLVRACSEDWDGEEVHPGLWEVSSPLGPHAFESALLGFLAPGDYAAFYYIADSKRLFRVVVDG